MGIRTLPPKKLRLTSQIVRARLLAAESNPIVAEPYRIHARICEGKVNSLQRRS
jgi:hypothetical protein